MSRLESENLAKGSSRPGAGACMQEQVMLISQEFLIDPCPDWLPSCQEGRIANKRCVLYQLDELQLEPWRIPISVSQELVVAAASCLVPAADADPKN